MTPIINVWGMCDGIGIIFEENSAGTWECDVPADFDDGEYVVELYAKDLAGNVAYMTARLFIFDSTNITLELIEDDFTITMLPDDVTISCVDDVRTTILDDELSIVVELIEYTITVKVA